MLVDSYESLPSPYLVYQVPSPPAAAAAAPFHALPNQTFVGLEVFIFSLSITLCVYQYRKLFELGSKYLVVITSLFTLFSTCIYFSGVVNYFNGTFSAFK